MPQNFLGCEREDALLLPPSLRESVSGVAPRPRHRVPIRTGTRHAASVAGRRLRCATAEVAAERLRHEPDTPGPRLPAVPGATVEHRFVDLESGVRLHAHIPLYQFMVGCFVRAWRAMPFT